MCIILLDMHFITLQIWIIILFDKNQFPATIVISVVIIYYLWNNNNAWFFRIGEALEKYDSNRSKQINKQQTNRYEKYYRQIGLNIAYYRKLRGMSQMALAEATDLSRTHISNIEAPNMKTSLSLESLFDIAGVLQVAPRALLDFRDEKPQDFHE